MRRRLRSALVGVILGVAMVGCTGDLPSASVSCEDLGGLTLIAQAVPEAQAIPCFPEIPFAYRTTTFDVESGDAEVRLSHAVLGADAAILTIAPQCVAEGSPVAARPDLGARSDHIQDGELGGVTGHLVQGLGDACLVVTLHMDHPDGRRALADLDGAWDLLSREDLSAALARETDGRLRLQDHAPGAQD